MSSAVAPSVSSKAQDRTRSVVAVAAMMATTMQALDGTIANVALPHMQASLNAGPDQIAWVLTSYIVASAITIPITGYLAVRFGRKRVFVVSVLGFTLTSALCGIATGLSEMVLYRALQGMFGAALVPLSQAMMLDSYPRNEQGRAMAIWGFGVMIGPVLGPTLGGWLTETYNWRWVFYINLPFGLFAAAVLILFAEETTRDLKRKFATYGFAVLAIGAAAMQMMLDRGEREDWFSSGEIILWAILAATGFYLFMVHMFTDRNPFFDTSILKDRNFLAGSILYFMIAAVMFSTVALTPVMLQSLMGYPVFDTGIMIAPRGLGMAAGMMIVSRIINKIDPRHVVTMGFVFMAIAMWEMTTFNIHIGEWPVLWTSTVQGLGLGMAFIAANTISYSSLPSAKRTEAAVITNAMRTVGSSIGISAMFAIWVQNSQINHALLAEKYSYLNENLARQNWPEVWDLAENTGRAALNFEVSRQAQMMAYLTDFDIMLIMCLVMVPFVYLIKRPPHPDELPEDF